MVQVVLKVAGRKRAEVSSPPPGWALDEERRLRREHLFPSGQTLSLYVSYVLTLAVRARVGVALACSGRRLCVTLVDPSKPHGEVSRKLFNFAVRLG